MRTVRLVWVEPSRGVCGLKAGVDDGVMERGALEPTADGDFPGPPGRYGLLPEEIWRTLYPDDPAPVFLHESYEAGLERWVNSLPDAAVEVTIVARVRDAVMQLVETRLAADPQAVSASPTVTTTEPTKQGMAVIGRCVVLRPSRTLHPSRSSSTDRQGARRSES
jgi:hypothetical protein